MLIVIGFLIGFLSTFFVGLELYWGRYIKGRKFDYLLKFEDEELKSG